MRAKDDFPPIWIRYVSEPKYSLDVPKTEFLGYTVLEGEAQVLRFLNEDNKVKIILKCRGGGPD